MIAFADLAEPFQHWELLIGKKIFLSLKYPRRFKLGAIFTSVSLLIRQIRQYINETKNKGMWREESFFDFR